MKKISFTLGVLMLIVIAISFILHSCKKDNNDNDINCPTVDYSIIDQTISEAQQLYNTSVEGSLPGQYTPGAKADLQVVLNTAKAVRDKECVTQQELDDANTLLEAAIDDFEAQKNPECPEVDYTSIDQTIADAQQRHDNAVEGTNPGEYMPGAKAELQQAINAAQAVRDKFCVTQMELNSAVNALLGAIDMFESKKVIDFSQDLVAHWLFNGDASDASVNGHHGTVSVGHPNWGGGIPTLAEDRHGNANYCYLFSDGGNIVVPNHPDLNPGELTVSMWLKLYETWAHNYLLSNDIWHAWKFQVQDANKPFFTRKILKDDGSGEYAWIDRDSNTGQLVNDEWTHVVVTYMSGEISFYIDGQETMFWNDFHTGTPVAPSDTIDFCIGQALATEDFSNDPGDPHEWKEWLGFFKGYMDDIRIYKTVLDEDIIYKIYEFEKNNTVID